MRNKKNHYIEPKIPESLRNFVSEDIVAEADARRNIQGAKKRVAVNGKRPTPNTKKKRPSTKSSKVAQKKLPNTKSSKRPEQRFSQETQRIATISEKSKRLKSKAKLDEATRRIAIAKGQRPITKEHRNVRKNIKTRDASLGDKARKTNLKKKKKNKRMKLSNIISMIAYGVILAIGFVLHGGDKSKYIKADRKKILDSKFNKYFSYGSMAVFLIFLVMMIASPRHKESIEENRLLQQKPSFSMASFASGEYSKKYADYIADQFPDRSGFIKAKAKFDRFLGKKEINGVYICKDGYLMEGFEPASRDITKVKADSINKFVKSNPKLNVAMMIVPNKVEIYRGLMPKNAPLGSQAKYLDTLSTMMDKRIRFINLINTFNSRKNSDQLYFKTDHHWTPSGAYIGYEEYMKKIGVNPTLESSFVKSLATKNFLGSLYYKNGAQIGQPENMYLYLKDKPYPLLVKYYDTKKKTTTLFDEEKLEERDPYEVFTGGNHSQIKIRTNVDSKRKLLLIKDSYANAMLPFLINNFAEINVVDLRYYTDNIKDILNNNEITDVLILYNVNTFNTDASIISLGDA